MCASATAILHWNAIPVFADIEEETFYIDPKSVLKNISSRTKAIMSVDIFGHSADMSELRKIANEYGLKIISDTAQAPVHITMVNIPVPLLTLVDLVLIIINIFILVKAVS